MVWVKRLGVVLAVVVVLLVAALAYVAFFVNSSTFKTELQKVALEKAGVHLRIDGDIHWTFFPWLGLELGNIGVAIGKDPEIVQFDRAEFGLAIMPLFHRTIEVDKVRLINLKANLAVDKSGHANWQHSVKTTAPSSDANSTKAKAATTTQPSKNSAYFASSSGTNRFRIPNIKLEALQIKNAQVNYQDAQTSQKIAATFNVNLSNVQWNKAWPMVVDAVVKKSDLQGKNPLTVSGKLSSDLTVFPEREAFSLAKTDLSVKLEGAALPTSPLNADLQVRQVDVDVPQENVFMDGVTLNALGTNATAKVKLYQVLSDPQFMVSVSMDDFSPSDLLKQLNIALPKMADNSVLGKASLDMKVEGSPHQILVQPLAIEFDDTTLNANIAADLSPLSWDANVSGSNLNVDRYLPPPSNSATAASSGKVSSASTGGSSSATPSSDNSAAAQLVPLDLVRSLNGHVGLTFKNLTVKKLQLDSLSLDATMAHGLVNVSPAVVNLYQGQAKLKAKYDARKAMPTLDVSTRVQDVEIEPLLQDFMALDKLSGTTSLEGEVSTKGNDMNAIMSGLNGDVLAEINNGSLVGMNLTKSVCQGIAAVRKQTLTNANFAANTPFETMDFPIHIVAGKVSTPGLTMQSAGLSVTGDGLVSLPDKSLDYQINVALAGSELDQACHVNQTLTNLAFPVVCQGKFSDDPAGLCRPDLVGFGRLFAKLAKQEAQAKLDAEKAQLKAKLEAEKAKLQAQKDAEAAAAKEKLKEKLKDKLKSLF